jgi:hypothetical protein
MAIYKAWIPTVSGRLSFAAIGYTQHPKKSVAVNVSDGKRHAFLVSQRRDCSDSIIPLKKILDPILFNQNGDFDFVFLGTSEYDQTTQKHDTITGRVLIFRHTDWKKSISAKFADKQIQLRKFRDHLNLQPLTDFFMAGLGEVEEILTSHSLFNIEIELMRTGELTLQNHNKLTISETAPPVNSDILGQEESDRILKLLVSQCYFFIRDISHNHQHHDPKTDTIIDVQRVEKSTSKNWCEPILYSLYRKLIEFKRKPTEENIYSARGILAYAMAFRGIFKKLGVKDSLLPEFEIDALSQSIDAATAKQIYIKSVQREKIAILPSLVISVLAIFIAFSSFAQFVITDQNTPHWTLSLFVVGLYENTPSVIASLVVFVVMISLVITKLLPGPKFSAASNKKIRSGLRLLNTLPKKINVSIWQVLALCSLSIAYYVFSNFKNIITLIEQVTKPFFD